MTLPVPTLAEQQAQWAGKPIPKGASRLDVTGRVNDRLFIVQQASDMFVHGGVSLLNGNRPVTFEAVK